MNHKSELSGCPVIDFHAHAFPEKIALPATDLLASHYKLTVSCPGTFDHLVQSSREAGVEKICLHMAATNADQVIIANNWIAERCSDSIIGFGSLHADYTDFEAEIDRMEGLGLTGIKFHSDFQRFNIDDPRMWPVYEAIGERFLVMFHVGDRESDFANPARLARVLDTFPGMKAIAAHLGGWSKWKEASEFILGRDVYVDTSSTTWMLPPEEISQLIRRHDINKVLFGTDYPIVSAEEELAAFAKIPLSDEEREKILWTNGNKLLSEFEQQKRKKRGTWE